MDITLDVFRDLGLAFAAAMVMIYIILVAQTGSFVVPLIVMMAIPLTVLGVMPGFYAPQRPGEPNRRRIRRLGLLHRHGHDRHDRTGWHRDPRLDHSRGFHPTGFRTRAARCLMRSWRAVSSVCGLSS